MSLELYHEVASKTSALTTKNYSTSFYLSTTLLSPEMRDAIYAIYGFVRYADEIVDSFHHQNKAELMEEFEKEFYRSLERDLSMNPILHSFLRVVKRYNIKDEYIQAFLNSMKADLKEINYSNEEELKAYIYGSADVVGLMCLAVFCKGDTNLFADLEKPAMYLGSAFQKVNFLRDLKNDHENLGRSYFPHVTRHNFTEESKAEIIADIENDFNLAYKGIQQLPSEAKPAVLLAYYYYRSLLNKLRRTPASRIKVERIRVGSMKKIMLMNKAIVYNHLGLI